MNAITIAMGFVVGFLVGLTGVGGAVLMTPFLVLVLKLPPSLAIGTDLTYAAITKAVGAWQHWKQKTANTHLVAQLAIGSIPASLAGVTLITIIRQAGDSAWMEVLLGRILAVILILVSLSMIWRAITQRPTHSSRPVHVQRPWWLTAIVGAVGGVAVGLTSVGSGRIVTALLITFYQLEASELVGTDILHAALLTGVSALAHIALGNVKLDLVGWLLIGSLPGVLLGSRLVPWLPERWLRGGLGVLVLFSSAKLLTER